MAAVEYMSNYNEFFVDTVDTVADGVKQHRKLKCLEGAISKGQIIDDKKQWTHEARDEAIKKTYAEYHQKELNEKGEKLRMPQVSM